jgi:hypothetical protein
VVPLLPKFVVLEMADQPTFTLTPYARLTTKKQPLTDDEAEVALFKRYSTGIWSQNRRTHRQWVWAYGYDIEVNHKRRYVCRLCIVNRSSKYEDFAAGRLQNVANHLYEDHGIRASEDETPSKAEQSASRPTAPLAQRQSILTDLQLDPENPRDQQIANVIISGFDRNRYQQLLLEWLMVCQLPFTIVQHKRLRAIFEYLNPSVKHQNAHISANTVRNRILQQYN